MYRFHLPIHPDQKVEVGLGNCRLWLNVENLQEPNSGRQLRTLSVSAVVFGENSPARKIDSDFSNERVSRNIISKLRELKVNQ